MTAGDGRFTPAWLTCAAVGPVDCSGTVPLGCWWLLSRLPATVLLACKQAAWQGPHMYVVLELMVRLSSATSSQLHDPSA